MTYNPLIPAASDLLSQSQSDIKSNFSAADVSFGINHYKFSDGTASNGKHKFVEMPIQTIPTILASEGALYTKTATQSQLFYTSDLGAKEYQLTRAVDASFASFATTPGWTFLPGGLLMQYGNVTPTSSADTVVFPVSFTTAVYSIQLTAVVDDNSSIRLSVLHGSVSITQFITEATSSSHFKSFYWMALGK